MTGWKITLIIDGICVIRNCAGGGYRKGVWWLLGVWSMKLTHNCYEAMFGAHSANYALFAPSHPLSPDLYPHSPLLVLCGWILD